MDVKWVGWSAGGSGRAETKNKTTRTQQEMPTATSGEAAEEIEWKYK